MNPMWFTAVMERSEPGAASVRLAYDCWLALSHSSRTILRALDLEFLSTEMIVGIE